METGDYEGPGEDDGEGADASPLEQTLGAIAERSAEMQKAIDELSEAIDEFKLETPEARKELIDPLEALSVAASEALRHSMPLAKAETALKLGAEESCHKEALEQTHAQMEEILKLTNEASELIAEESKK